MFTREKIDKCTNLNACDKVIQPKKDVKKEWQLISFKCNNGYYVDENNWTHVSLNFIAQGYEQFFSIGNFNSDRKTKLTETRKVDKKEHKFSYYYIDDVEIVPVEIETVEEIEKPLAEEPIFEVEKTYAFKDLIFEFDKWEIQEYSFPELDKLVQYLKSHPDIHIEIHGHTDNVGTDERNKILSEMRAGAVVVYLNSKGVDIKRISFYGHGSSQPKVLNNTESNRAINRRVEFKLIKA